MDNGECRQDLSFLLVCNLQPSSPWKLSLLSTLAIGSSPIQGGLSAWAHFTMTQDFDDLTAALYNNNWFDKFAHLCNTESWKLRAPSGGLPYLTWCDGMSLSSRPAFTDKLPFPESCQGISCSDQFLMLLCSSLLSNHCILSSVERLARFFQD